MPSSRKPQRPKGFRVGLDDEIRGTAIRPRRESGPDDGRWYWIAFVRIDGRKHIRWKGWATRREAYTAVSEAYQAGALEEDGPQYKPADATMNTVGDLARWWLLGRRDGTIRPKGSTIKADGAQLSAGTLRIYTYAVKSIVRHLDNELIEHACRSDTDITERYAHARLSEKNSYGKPVAPYTVEQELRVLQQVWRAGWATGLVPKGVDLPMVKIERRAVRCRHTPCAEDVRAVIERLTGWPRMAVVLLFGTGARIGEIAELRWRDVDLARGTVALDGKTGRRVFPLHDDTLAELRAWPEGAPDAYVLGVKPNTTRHVLITRHMARAIEGAGVERFTPHGLRRAAITQMRRRGVRPEVAAKLMGHTVDVMWRFYTDIDDTEQREAVAQADLGRMDMGVTIPFPGKGR